jgi:TolB-like protein/class 3 adenylate cyclase/Flp pilus assembly protein TadD
MAEAQPDFRLEIAHVLFIDIVGFSKSLINEQSEMLRLLNQIVRNTSQVKAAEAEGKLTRLPTGDGMALAFFTSPDAPLRCAIEIAEELKHHPALAVRMGINSGPVDEVVDVNERSNLAGTGINIAQRVMDCGDAGHILLSKRSADDLAQYGKWRPHLHDLGPCEIKHGTTIDLVNFHDGEAGNPATPDRLAGKKKIAPSSRAKSLAGIWLAAAAALLVGLGVWFFFRSTAPKSSTASTTQSEKRIAVLPFKPLLPENRDQVLELGMADTLITKLSNSRQLVVSSLNSVRKFIELDQDSIAAGRELQVGSVLEGNVQKAGDKIKVTARLIKVADGSSLWAGSFEDKFTDVFGVQDTIAQKVADALALRLNTEENKRLIRRYTDNVEAYQLYLTGRYHWAKLTPPEVKKSIEFFNKAIDLDPTYALAYFGLADAYRALAPTSDVPPKDTLPKAKAAATKAIELDESLAEPHVSLSFIHSWLDWDWAGAEQEARRAIELNPNLGFAHLALAQALSHVGRHQEAVAEAGRARELDPVSLYINALNGQYLVSAGRYDEAIAKLKQTLELDPNFWITHFMLGTAYIEKRLYPEALTEFSKATELSKGNAEAIMMTGYTWAMAGEPAKARTVLAELRALTDQHVPAEHIAMLCSVLGEKDEAFVWLEKACENREVRLCRLKVDPRWDSLRSDPRFAAILKRIGLE